jgi:hypothetical protein
MKWYIGQEIVCIKTHSQGAVKSGEIYTIKALSSCKCNLIMIDVGIKSIDGKYGRCALCGIIYPLFDAWLISERLFAPLEYNQEEIEKLLENTLLEKL